MPKSIPTGPGLEPSSLPFSKVVEANGFVFLAGQIGDEPGSNGPVAGGIEAETRAMLENVGRLLRAVGLDYRDVVKCTVYLTDITEFFAMNTVYREYFTTDLPTRATVAVAALALGAKVEIEVLAAR
ncbi:MAG TPA: Rid family detoxifying hydrolase [Candidatus Limnocylindrales bacterium]|nr:Rid family detoxifying hydrolase [Candidatus Limnocylindrales bacterium]